MANIDHNQRDRDRKKPNLFSSRVFLNEVLVWDHMSAERSWATLQAFQNTSWSAEICWSAVLHGDGQWCCGWADLLGSYTLFSPCLELQPVLGMASSIWIKSSTSLSDDNEGWWEESSLRGNLKGQQGPISKKEQSSCRTQTENGTQGEGYTETVILQRSFRCCCYCCSARFLLLLLKLATQKKRMMMCWERENFPLLQAVKHLHWAILKRQHQHVMVYRKMHYYQKSQMLLHFIVQVDYVVKKYFLRTALWSPSYIP